MDYYTSDNASTPGLGEYPPVAFYFKVRFFAKSGEVAGDTSFQEVSGISQEVDIEPVTEGGENGFIHQLPKPVKHQKLVLKRGMATKNSVLIDWCSAVLGRGFAYQIITRQIQVSLMNAEGTTIRAWDFSNAYPVKWSVDNFNSSKNEVAIETIELAHSGFKRTV